MSSRFFESFCEMVEALPIKAVIRAADAERRMVNDDLREKRAAPTQETLSVLQFCDFLVAAAQGAEISFPAWPVEHCAFYRKVVQRLVEAGELPFEVKEQFDLTFSRTLLKALAGPA